MKADEKTLVVTDIQQFCMHDGPGLRTVVFLKGCPLNCIWCHNPETQDRRPQILFSQSSCMRCGMCVTVCPDGAQKTSPDRVFNRVGCSACSRCASICPTGALKLSGVRMTVSRIMDKVCEDAPFFTDEGGLTVSGGEPTAQPEALIELLKEARNRGVGTCIETCGVFSKDVMESILPLTDLFLFDLKDTDAARLRKNTGADLEIVLSNLKAIDERGGRTVLRCILIPEVNMNREHCFAIADVFRSLSCCQYVELLPYHPYGTSKAIQLGRSDCVTFERPSEQSIMDFAQKLRGMDVPVKCFGTTLQ